MCQAFGVSRSGYYAWQRRSQTTQREQAERLLRDQIGQIYAESHQTYGSPRIYAELKARGIPCSRDRVALLMRDTGLAVRPAHRRVNTTQARAGQTTSLNLLDRDFSADAPNRKWLVDIMAISTDEGWLYLAGVLDLFSRRLVGWAMDEHMPDELTQDALEMAILQRKPPAQLLHHSDQGSQYTSDDYQALLAKHKMLTSLSGVGCCYDNAPMESFWATLKTELVYPTHYHTRAEAKNAIFAYIEGWYNRQRRHSTLGYLSPEQFERQFQP
ncbi:MAG: IS3 family transposase [Anaerolineae bacterium]|nr:IS3 family transposase [Anaerolineae bacterium]